MARRAAYDGDDRLSIEQYAYRNDQFYFGTQKHSHDANLREDHQRES